VTVVTDGDASDDQKFNPAVDEFLKDFLDIELRQGDGGVPPRRPAT
jgi:hypothetical protein